MSFNCVVIKGVQLMNCLKDLLQLSQTVRQPVDIGIISKILSSAIAVLKRENVKCVCPVLKTKPELHVNVC